MFIFWNQEIKLIEKCEYLIGKKVHKNVIIILKSVAHKKGQNHLIGCAIASDGGHLDVEGDNQELEHVNQEMISKSKRSSAHGLLVDDPNTDPSSPYSIPWYQFILKNDRIPIKIIYHSIAMKVELKSCIIIYYQPPRNLQYYSIQPLILDLKQVVSFHQAELKLNRKVHLHAADFKTQSHCFDIDPCLQIINSESSTSKSTPFSIPSIIKYLGAALCTFLVFLFQAFMYILNVKLPVIGSSLCILSCTAQQFNLRLEQACFWPAQYAEWFHSNDKKSPFSQAQYIGFFNTFWLVANDVIIGMAVKTALVESKDVLSISLEQTLETFTLKLIQAGLEWLMAWPVGLKLNSELAFFLSELFLWMIHAWREFLWVASPYFPGFFVLAGYMGMLGATFSISMISDMITLLTAHLQLFYIISARIYNWALNIIASTFNLFRGRKWNPLRNRIDSAEYDLDQLLIGATMFTLFVFLFPTVTVYYLMFCMAISAITIIQSGFEILLAILNHFPLFALMLRLKDPKRLSGLCFLPFLMINIQ